MYRFISIFIFTLGVQFCFGQYDTIELKNPSFEDSPRRGGYDLFGYPTAPPAGWFDCGLSEFPNETPPDIHPVDFWEVERQAQDGYTYLGMVVRDVDSWEAVSQRLESPVKSGGCYKFSIYLSRSDRYVSLSQEQNRIDNYTTPTVLRIWGGNGICGRKSLLAESDPVTNFQWEKYEIEFKSDKDYNYITFEAFYKTPTLFAYNGHILIDHASALYQVSCPGEEVISQEETIEETTEEKDEVLVEKAEPIQKKVDVKKSEEKEAEFAEESPAKEKIEKTENTPATKYMTELDRKKIKKGQTIRIQNLYFKADTSTISSKSFSVLNEVYEFLDKNEDIVVEIGGHTNGLPEPDYCDKLSLERAKAVADYLIEKGIAQDRLEYKGYGKRKPVASNKSKIGRQKNQRVEIKILSLDS